MAVLEIKTYGDPVLRKKAEKITDFGPETQEIFGNMLETMYHNNGVGLAANQVGIAKAMITVDTGQEDPPAVYMLTNPEIIEHSKEKSVFEEGCLSFPGITEKIERPVSVKIKARNHKGEEVIIEASGILATVLQHEIDHINGTVFIDRMSPVKRIMHGKELKEIKKLRKQK